MVNKLFCEHVGFVVIASIFVCV